MNPRRHTTTLDTRTRVLSVVGVAGLLLSLAATGWAMTSQDATVTTRSTTSTGRLVSVSSRQVADLRSRPAQASAQRSGTGLPEPSATWVASVAATTTIPAVALQAYGRATLRLAQEQPTCHLSWPTLAGIGAIESDHGRSSGGMPDENGDVSPAILGPALDGSPGLAAIRATEQSTQWHGNATWDHAVGPMQFIPSTWETWGADGNADGIANPNNIADAALAAARYLCADGRDLRTGAGWTQAVHSYNQSDAYVNDVYRNADAYALASRSG